MDGEYTGIRLALCATGGVRHASREQAPIGFWRTLEPMRRSACARRWVRFLVRVTIPRKRKSTTLWCFSGCTVSDFRLRRNRRSAPCRLQASLTRSSVRSRTHATSSLGEIPRTGHHPPKKKKHHFVVLFGGW